MASGLVALVLLLLVATLVRGADEAEGGAAGGLPAGPDLFPLLSGLGSLVMAAVLVVGIIGSARERRRVPMLLGALLLAALVAALAWGIGRIEPWAAPAPDEEAVPEPDVPPVERPEVDTGFGARGPLLLAGALAAAAVALLVARSRTTHVVSPAVEEGGGSDADGASRRRISAGLGELIEELRHDPDPRRAVITAWAALERLLAEHALERRPAEAPTTYVARVLGRLVVSGWAVQRVTTAFERAMFSPHEIHRADQLAAADALVAVRDELEVRT